MKSKTFRAFLAMGALAIGAGAAVGCVSDRPSRNGVYNENQYLRKSFLVSGDGSADPGWFLQATITKASTPNPLGPLGSEVRAEDERPLPIRMGPVHIPRD